jgi:hypothetical protein
MGQMKEEAVQKDWNDFLKGFAEAQRKGYELGQDYEQQIREERKNADSRKKDSQKA